MQCLSRTNLYFAIPADLQVLVCARIGINSQFDTLLYSVVMAQHQTPMSLRRVCETHVLGFLPKGRLNEPTEENYLTRLLPHRD